jgi:hypothetical protein
MNEEESLRQNTLIKAYLEADDDENQNSKVSG